MMLTLPNFISFIRIPLAFLFLQENPAWRLFAILFAMLTDGLDGFLARHYNSSSKFGTMLDPIADKFFVIFAAVILVNENRLLPWEAFTLACRDISVLIYGIYLISNKRLIKYQFRAIRCGKITTLLQFFVLVSLTMKIAIPSPLYIMFILLGLLSLVELAVPLVKFEPNNTN